MGSVEGDMAKARAIGYIERDIDNYFEDLEQLKKEFSQHMLDHVVDLKLSIMKELRKEKVFPYRLYMIRTDTLSQLHKILDDPDEKKLVATELWRRKLL